MSKEFKKKLISVSMDKFMHNDDFKNLEVRVVIQSLKELMPLYIKMNTSQVYITLEKNLGKTPIVHQERLIQTALNAKVLQPAKLSLKELQTQWSLGIIPKNLIPLEFSDEHKQ